MRKLLLITTALVGFALLPGPAQAGPLATISALLGNGVGLGAAISGTFGVLGAGLLKIGGSLLLSRAAALLQGGGRVEEQRAELARPTALPAYRYVYGTCWAPGTPLGWQVVGDVLYVCYLLNSRASALTSHTVLFDKRAVTKTGDPFDFTSGGGAVATNDPFDGHLKYWIGRGNQTTAPAQIVAEASDFSATDAWQGCTVLWARMDCGDTSERASRWPTTPPELNVEGQWSLVYDPRDGLTKHSRNQALIVLDALLNSPAKPHAMAQLQMDTVGWGADVADQAVPVKAGGTIPRYRADGVLVWSRDAELEDQIQPLLDAGASRLTRIGGQLAFVPACARASVLTITDFTKGQPLVLERWQPADSLFTDCTATYTNPARAYESAEAPVFVEAGAVGLDGGLPNRLKITLDFVTDHRQAQRVAAINLRRSRMQHTVAGELFPADGMLLVSGAICTLDLPAPMTGWNGPYIVEEADPTAGINDDESVTLRVPVKLRREDASVYAWNHLTDEKDVADAVFDSTIATVQRPASINVVSGSDAAIVSGSTITARVRASWPASTSASVSSYEWEWRREAGAWQAGGTLSKSAERVAYVAPVSLGDDYEVRVRSIGIYGASTWRESAVVVASGPTIVIAAPDIRSATGGVGQVALVLDQADDPACSKIEVWRSTTNDVGTASRITTRNAAANVTVSWTNTGLAAGTYYYWARAADAYDNVSAFSAVKSATVT